MTDDEKRRGARHRRRARKDRLIQTRVAEDLESALKKEAARRRLTVSHLIRNTLEDTFNLVEGVTTDVEQLVSGSVELAAAVSRDARRFASLVRGRGEPHPEHASPDAAGKGANSKRPRDTHQDTTSKAHGAPAGPAPTPEHIYGWNRLIANRDARCASCQATIRRGDDALVGLSDDPTEPRVWLCHECGTAL